MKPVSDVFAVPLRHGVRAVLGGFGDIIPVGGSGALVPSGGEFLAGGEISVHGVGASADVDPLPRPSGVRDDPLDLVSDEGHDLEGQEREGDQGSPGRGSA